MLQQGIGDLAFYVASTLSPAQIRAGAFAVEASLGVIAYTLPSVDGAANQIIETDGSGNLSWVDPPSGGMTNPMTTADDMIVGGVGGAPERLAKGANDQVLTMVGGSVQWAASQTGGVTTFVGLNDTPANYTGAGGQIVAVNTGATALEFRQLVEADISDLGTYATQAALDAHTTDTGNPHSVTAGQVGADPAGSAAAVQSNLDTHTGNAAIHWTNPMTTSQDIIVGGVSGAATRLAVGTNDQVLKVVAGNVEWAAEAGGGATELNDLTDVTVTTPADQHVLAHNGAGQFVNRLLVEADISDLGTYMTNPMTAVGDVITGGSAGAPTRLPVGSDGQVLTIQGSVPAWVTPSGGAFPGLAADYAWTGTHTHGEHLSFTSTDGDASPTGTTAAVNLTDSNHIILDVSGASGDVTATITMPTNRCSGTILLIQGATQRDITWTPATGSIKWLGTEPTWNDAGEASKDRIVSFHWDGTTLRLMASSNG